MLPPVHAHKLSTPNLESDGSLSEVGVKACKGVVSPKEASQWYTIVKGSLEQAPAQGVAAWDPICNTHSREACWAHPKLPAPLGDPSRQVGHGGGAREVQAGRRAILSSMAPDAHFARHRMVIRRDQG